MKIVIKQEDITVRNRAYGQARSEGRLATRVIRDRTKYRRKQKHKGKGEY
jgi:hypothetical protein